MKLRGLPGIHNIYKFALQPRSEEKESDNSVQSIRSDGLEVAAKAKAPRESIVNLAIAPLVAKDFQEIGRLIIFDDITDRDDLERRSGTSR